MEKFEFNSCSFCSVWHNTYNHHCRLALKPSQPPTKWLAATMSPGMKRLECKAKHSHSSSAEVNNAWSYEVWLLNNETD